jgi:hypothetical protein
LYFYFLTDSHSRAYAFSLKEQAFLLPSRIVI